MSFNTDLNAINTRMLASAAVAPALPKIPAAAAKRKKVCVIATQSNDREAQAELAKRTRLVEELAFVSFDTLPVSRLERNPTVPVRLSNVPTDSHENKELAGIVDQYVNSQM